MRTRVSHPYLHTRVSLLARHLLQPGSAADAVARPLTDNRQLLERAGALALLPEAGETGARFAEQRRLGLLLEDLLIVVRALSGPPREFFRYWSLMLELTNLKTIVRGRLTGEPATVIRGQLLDMGPFGSLPVESLLRAENALEVLRMLDRTPYAEIARQARRVLEQQRDLFFLDTTFDRRFYAGLVRRAKAIHTHDPEGFRRLMAALVDGLNLEWLLRYRFVYRLPPAETYFLLIASDYHLDSRALRALVAAPSLEAVVAALPARLAAESRGATGVEAVHARMERYLRRTALELLGRSGSAFTRAFAYLILRDRDLRLLRGLIKGEQLGVDAAVRRAALVAPLEQGLARV
jgi:V/A-type H+-transporting ATPase subunit C